MLTPRTATVRPYVFMQESGVRLALEQVVAPYVAAPRPGRITILGDDASGKTTALEHLAAVLRPPPGVLLLDEPDPDELESASASSLVLATFNLTNAPRATEDEHLRLTLSGWSRDDWIEYLLAAHRAGCDSVMRRLLSSVDVERLDGSPLLLRLVMDGLAGEEKLTDVFNAISGFIASQPLSEADREAMDDACIAAHCNGFVRAEDFETLANDRCDPRMRQMLRLNAVQQLFVCERFVADLGRREPPDYLGRPWTPDTIAFCGGRLHGKQHILKRLARHAHGRVGIYQPTAASLLIALGVDWRPRRGRVTKLDGAYLPGVQWPGIDLRLVSLVATTLNGADLSDAILSGTIAARARFSGARLLGAKLDGIDAHRADFSDADLTHIRGDQTNFSSADFSRARLDGAQLTGAKLMRARLDHARLVRADLSGAAMMRSSLRECDFTAADLSRAMLLRADLRDCTLAGAKFAGAMLSFCNLEGQQIPGADFSAADLSSAMLTATVMPRANFSGANLSSAGLAEIEWEGADLSGADLREASFHLGSTRSGLVGSPLASEGTRTGFYTDEYQEQDFRSVEEIRKANLRGADLRGANIEKTDFYLVDLRDAKYTPEQEVHLRRTGAILETRV